MIEAVNSVLSNSSATRVAVEQQSNTRSFASNPERAQEVARTPYVSPYVSIDRGSSRAVLQIRDSDTGDVVRQFPTEGQLRAYRTAQEFTRRQETREQLTGGNGVPEVSRAPQPDVSTPQVQETSVETEA